MISYLQGAILGLLQGVTEPFPVSSLGHGVILPRVLGWDIHQNDTYFLAFLVATHLATALVLLGLFWSDWKRIVSGVLRSLRQREIRHGSEKSAERHRQPVVVQRDRDVLDVDPLHVVAPFVHGLARALSRSPSRG